MSAEQRTVQQGKKRKSSSQTRAINKTKKTDATKLTHDESTSSNWTEAQPTTSTTSTSLPMAEEDTIDQDYFDALETTVASAPPDPNYLTYNPDEDVEETSDEDEYEDEDLMEDIECTVTIKRGQERQRMVLKKGVMPTQNIPRRLHDRVLTPNQLKKREERQQRFLKRHAALSAAARQKFIDELRNPVDQNSERFNKGGHSKTIGSLKNMAVPTTMNNNLEYSWLLGEEAPQSPPYQDFDEDMQKESIVRPPNILCAIYSLPDANPDVQDAVATSENCLNDNTQVLDSTEVTEDMDSYYSRCLLCTCRSDATPHMEIFSEAGNQLQLAEKLDKHLNFQIEPGLPQRVCHSCLEKLQVTHELATSSQQAKIMLLQIKQRIKNFSTDVTQMQHIDIQQPFQIKVEPESTDFVYSMNPSGLDQPAVNSAAMDHEIDIKANEIPSEDSDSTQSADEYHSENSRKRSAAAKKTGETGSTWEDETDGPSEEDFIKCSECSEVIYKGYMAFHMKLCHEDIKPVKRKRTDGRTKEQIQEDRRRKMLLGRIECSLCKKQFYSQVLNLHVSLQHKFQKTAELLETNQSRLMQCPSCPCMFFPEYMQGHMAEKHPPAPNPHLKHKKECIYCNLMVSYCALEQHLDSEHGLNAWRRCIHCRKKVRNTDTDMEAHLFQEHHGGKLLVCEICDVRYAKTGKEQAHMQTFLSCKYKCPLQTCKKTFATLLSFKDHVVFSHPKIEEELQAEIQKEIEDFLDSMKPVEKSVPEATEDPKDTDVQKIPAPPKQIVFEPILSQVRRPDYGGEVECDICKETVKHKWYLIQHKNKVHGMNLSFNCEECGKKYQIMQGILNHIHRSHLPKDQICEICGEAFTKRLYSTHLIWHKRYPYGTQPRNLLDRPLDPVRCAMCNHPARNKYALLTHINAEHLDVVGERLRFHCEPCDKEFVTYEYLMQHNYSKHLPKIVCTYCGKLFTQNRMSMHLKIHEPDRGSDYKGKNRGRKPTRTVNVS